MRTFKEFLKQGMIKEREKDEARARSLIESAEKRKHVMEKYLPLNQKHDAPPILKDGVWGSARALDARGVTDAPRHDETAVHVIEESYDVIRELLEAKLSKEGYKSYNHEAVVVYLAELGFSEEEILFVDSLREIRNGTKYYGKNVTREYAAKVKNFLDGIYLKLKEIASA